MKAADVLVIGGGASGITAAVSAAEQGDRVLLLEAQAALGRKILASGNGRCNLMNTHPPVYYGDSSFAADVLRFCPPERIRRFWERYGLHLRADEAGRVYPCTFQAASVMDALRLAMRKNRVTCLLQQRVTGLKADADGFCVQTQQQDLFEAKRIILAAGGPAQPKLGGREDGPQLLRPFGHKAAPFIPSLTPLITDARSVSGLAGIRVRAQVQIWTDGRETHRETGEVLFTQDGLSGICIMQCARFVTPGMSRCRLNLIHDLFPDSESAVRELMRRKALFPEEDPVSLIAGICLPKVAFAVCKQAGLPMRGEKNADLSEEQVRAIVGSLSGYTLQIIGRKGFDQAQVSAGGLDCSAFSPETMASLRTSGLHAAGEMLNVDGDCGGYNLMFAWATGILAGTNGRGEWVPAPHPQPAQNA